MHPSLRNPWRRPCLRVVIPVLMVLFIAGRAPASESAWIEIPPAQWKGATAVEVPPLKRKSAAAIALPAKEAKVLMAMTAEALPPGLYEIRVTVRPSHTACAIAFNAGLRLKAGDSPSAVFFGQFFARPHEPETRLAQGVQSKAGPLTLTLEAFADAGVADKSRTEHLLKKGGPNLGDDLKADGESAADFDLELRLTPDRAVYYVVDKIEVRPLSRSGRVMQVATDKIRYRPGDTLKGTATLADLGRKGGTGTVELYLEHGVKGRVKAKSLPVTLKAEPQTLSFEVQLPKDELGYALAAEFVSADGGDHSEAAEYFTVAENFQRVALFGGNAGSTRDATLDEAPIRKALAESRAQYYNTVEYPFWAPDDLLELTPAEDYWFSGQANYHMNKQTLQRQIRIAHEQGVAMVTYGKWCVSGAPGWEAVYDRPWDFNGTYRQPIGSWDSHNTWVFDLRRNGEQVPYSPRPGGEGWFDPWWSEFIGIGPNASPSMIKSAAEEMAASADMFGWDAVRWDGHIRAGWNATGRSGQYQQWAARQTQSLMRYFKEIVEQKRPGFRHGYNYFLIEPDKGYEWAKEDFELDELCRGGGLLMNESIGNASGGWSFDQIARNLQVEGDLSRERGGFYLGISFAKSPRDLLIESALWAAAGCRPYSGAMIPETRRYLTRYAQYTLDERLRRLATPEKILAPQAETKLWWQPFVYETPLENGRRQIVINLLNIPREDKRPARDGKEPPVWNMPAGTEPVTFALTLPEGLKAEVGHLIDPWTLEVQSLPLGEGRFTVPAVAIWRVVVLDVAADAKAPALAELYGPPKTLGARRETIKDERLPEVVVDPGREVWEVNKSLQPLEPDWMTKQRQEREAFDAMSPAERIEAMKKRRDANTVEALSAHWWKGGVLPDDLKRKDQKVDYGNLAPQRNGRMDIFYGRGAMDHRLRLPEAMARLDRFSAHDAQFGGAFRGGGLGGMWLANNVPWQRFPEFDLLLFTGIPYAAIGIDNCYALPEYVKAGGAVFFTGGEWAFGKGGYFKTVLERELLPVLCVEMDDCRTLPPDKPAIMIAGRDFAELGCQADFAAKPSFWVYNQVLLKEDSGVKVFLNSDQGPMLVGWQLGKGRVACLLVDYRGKSSKDVTAFFDWPEWPRVAASVMRWLAPEAGKTGVYPGALPAAEVKKLTAQLEGASIGDIMEAAGGDLLSPGPAGKGKKVKAGDRDARVAALRRLLSDPAATVDTGLLLDQLLAPNVLPDDVRWRIIDKVGARPPAMLAERVREGLADADALVRQNALQLLGLVDGMALGRELHAEVTTTETDARGRTYALVLALPWVKTQDLVEEGRRRVAAWNASEKAVLDTWTGGKGFSAAAPELPGLDAMSLYQRLAWLAYLSQHDPKTYGAQFAREWLKTGVYQEYCWRTKGTYEKVGKKSGDWERLSACFGRLRDLARPAVESLAKTAPDALAAGLCQAHFTHEILASRNLLGGLDRASAACILEKVKAARNPDLAAFAAARAGQGSRE